MAYFALLVPSTALAKAAGSSWWSQGATYLWNFVAPYTLWLPLGAGRPWWSRPGWHGGGGSADRTGVLVLCTPLVVGLVDLVYVVEVGGDYMHARLLLPAFFAMCLPVYVGVRSLRGALVVPVARASPCGRWCASAGCDSSHRPSHDAHPPDRLHLQRAQQLDHRPPGTPTR